MAFKKSLKILNNTEIWQYDKKFGFLFVILIIATNFNLCLSASVHHKDYRNTGLFALNNFTDLSGSSPSQASSIKTMDLTSVELNTIDVGDFDTAAASRNLQLGTKENTGKLRKSKFNIKGLKMCK